MIGLKTVLTLFALHLFFLPSIQSFDLFEGHTNLEKRQGAVNGNICAQVDLVLLGITVVRQLCLCAEGGALTPASVLAINQQVTANQGVLAPVINIVGGLSGAITTITANALPLLLSQPTSCRYPANSRPNACGSCAYECQPTFVPCGAFCIASGASCVSGVPGRKRDLLVGGSKFYCSKEQEACLIPEASGANSAKFLRHFECIETQNDIESCGGCIHPLKGLPAGQDCTNIPNAASVSCISGRCVINDCISGYVLNETSSCVKIASNSKGLFGDYWSVIEDGSRVVLSS